MSRFDRGTTTAAAAVGGGVTARGTITSRRRICAFLLVIGLCLLFMLSYSVPTLNSYSSQRSATPSDSAVVNAKTSDSPNRHPPTVEVTAATTNSTTTAQQHKTTSSLSTAAPPPPKENDEDEDERATSPAAAAAAARIKNITPVEQNEDEDEDENPNNHPATTIVRVRFTQGWSTGHVGTRFLSSLFSKVTRGSSVGSNSSRVGNDDDEEEEEIVDPWWLVWNEHELDIGPFLTPNNSERDCDTSSSSNSNTDDDTLLTIKALEHYMLNKKKLRWYGKHLKQWNSKGDLASIRHYIQSERLPTIAAVIAYFYCHRHQNNTTNTVHTNNTHATNNNNKTPSSSSSSSSSSQFLHHLIKFGHTAIFYNLPTLYDEFTNTHTILTNTYNNQKTRLQIEFDMDFLRIVRKRRYIARSFALHANAIKTSQGDRFRPGPCFYRTKKMGIVTCPYDATSLLQLKSTSTTDTTLWNSWSSFQQHLWFADEIQAQWLHFLSLYNTTTHTHTNTNTTKTSIRYHTLQYDDQDQISGQEIDKLAKYLNLPGSPRKYMQSTDKKSHLKTTKSNTNIPLSEEIMKQQAIEYAQTAPWCIQYNTTTNNDDADDDDGKNHSQLHYPILIDCSYDS